MLNSLRRKGYKRSLSVQIDLDHVKTRAKLAWMLAQISARRLSGAPPFRHTNRERWATVSGLWGVKGQRFDFYKSDISTVTCDNIQLVFAAITVTRKNAAAVLFEVARRGALTKVADLFLSKQLHLSKKRMNLVR